MFGRLPLLSLKSLSAFCFIIRWVFFFLSVSYSVAKDKNSFVRLCCRYLSCRWKHPSTSGTKPRRGKFTLAGPRSWHRGQINKSLDSSIDLLNRSFNGSGREGGEEWTDPLERGNRRLPGRVVIVINCSSQRAPCSSAEWQEPEGGVSVRQLETDLSGDQLELERRCFQSQQHLHGASQIGR